ncbi:MAG: prephenate dehydrogenase [Lachnospiraceae bacterium]|nr:prephenate dehydrogenase [Lachnospiraceae bacterium]
MNNNIKVAFIGLGLIGGSIAKTIRKTHPSANIIALNRSSAPLEEALSDGVINAGTHEIDDNFKDCDIIFLCTPVETNTRFLPLLSEYLTPDTILTDAGSVKGEIHDAVSRLLPDAPFIGGHPMAGSEKSGYANSSDHLMENAYYILTPGPNAKDKQIKFYSDFVSSLGAIPMILSPEEHDYITGAISHVPHLIAYSLVKMVKDADGEDEHMKMIAAGGFKDITRIAGSDPTMWEQICLENRDNILSITDLYIDTLKELKSLVENRDSKALYSVFRDIKEYRSSFSTQPKGPIKKQFDLYCDIIDEAGAIATIATILSTSDISIKNIGIVHNRTFEEGALHIAFYDEESCSRACDILKRHNYKIYDSK